MNHPSRRFERVTAMLEDAVRLERSLAGRLATQGSSLRRGAIDEIDAACVELERVRAELLRVGTALRSECAALAGKLSLPLGRALELLPAGEDEALDRARAELAVVHKNVRWNQKKNAAFARSALDALAEVKAAFARAQDAVPGAGAAIAALDLSA